jgi:hypothetical protein
MKTIILLMIIGKAMIGSQLVYTEKHSAEVFADGIYQSLTTEYFDEKENNFAGIKSDFSKSRTIPDYKFTDKRNGITETVQKSEDGKKILIEITEKNQTKKNELTLQENSVLSQGFHNYILLHLDELKKNSLEVNFIVPRKADLYRFTIQKEKSEGDQIEFSIKPSSFFLKAVVPKILLTYDLKTKHLLTFNGMTNIDGPNGETLKAVINYVY